MSGIAFTSNPTTGTGRARDSFARLPSGEFLSISAAQREGRVEIGISAGMVQAWMIFTPAQARSVASELLACANAYESGAGAQGGAE